MIPSPGVRMHAGCFRLNSRTGKLLKTSQNLAWSWLTLVTMTLTPAMAQNPSGNDEVKVLLQRGYFFNGQPVQFQVVEFVFGFEKLVVAQGLLAHIKRHHAGVAVVVGNDGGLVGAATGHQNVHLGAVFLVWPEQAVRMARVKPLPVADKPPRQIQYGLGIHPACILV